MTEIHWLPRANTGKPVFEILAMCIAFTGRAVAACRFHPDLIVGDLYYTVI
jgi:hypothetical protein